MMRKGKRSDSVLWQKPIHQRKNPKSNVTTQNVTKNFDYTTINLILLTALGRKSVSLTTQLVRLNRFTGSQPSNLPQIHKRVYM